MTNEREALTGLPEYLMREAARIDGMCGADSIAGRHVAQMRTWAAALSQPSPADSVPVQRPSDDEMWDKTLRERDNCEDWADKLAERIGWMTGEEIGEHSSANNPWIVALDAADQWIASNTAPTEPAQPAVQSIADMPELQAAVTRGFADGSLQIVGEQPATQAGAGSSAFDSWYAQECATNTGWTSSKQIARDAYAAGLRAAPTTEQPAPQAGAEALALWNKVEAYADARVMESDDGNRSASREAAAKRALRMEVELRQAFGAMTTPTTEQPGDAEDAARWREHASKLDALIAFCPTCSEGKVASADMTRDEVIFQCGKTSGRSAAARAAHGKGGE